MAKNTNDKFYAVWESVFDDMAAQNPASTFKEAVEYAGYLISEDACLPKEGESDPVYIFKLVGTVQRRTVIDVEKL